MTAMTLLSRVLGLVREQVRAIYLGTGAASDAFGLAVTIPNLFRRLFAEGAMTAAFIPVFSEYLTQGDEEETRAFLSRFLTLLTIVLVVFAGLGVLVTPWLIETFFSSEFQHVPGKVRLTTLLTQLMWPYLVLVSLAAFIQGVLNANKIFAPSAFTPVLLNAAIIGCGIGFAEVLPDPSYALVTGFLVGGVVQLGFQIPFLMRWTRLRFGADFRFLDPGVVRVMRIMIPGVFAAGIYQINVFVSQLIASMLEGGSIAALQYGIRLQELVLGLFVVSIAQVILPTLSEQTAQKDHVGVQKTLRDATHLMAYVTLPATVGLVLLGAPVIRLLFQYGAFDQESTAKTAFALVFYALGLFPIAMTRVQQQVFYAHKDLKTPTWIAAGAALINIVLCVLLSEPLGHGGIALAGSVAAAVSMVLFVVLLKKKIGLSGGLSTLGRLLRIAIAAALMALVLWGGQTIWHPDSIESHAVLGCWVALMVTAGGAIYAVSCWLLGVDELAVLWAALSRRKQR
jgi:putative peptidoglycan lipid II flippase